LKVLPVTDKSCVTNGEDLVEMDDDRHDGISDWQYLCTLDELIVRLSMRCGKRQSLVVHCSIARVTKGLLQKNLAPPLPAVDLSARAQYGKLQPASFAP
jgi:hypothetical protein